MPRERWPEWREVLRRHRIQGIAGWLLEAGAPLALISAQLLYIGGPWLGTGAHQLAHLLESDEETMEFLRFLDSGPQDVQEFPPGID